MTDTDSLVEYAKLMKEWNEIGVFPTNVLNNTSSQNRDEYRVGQVAVEQHHTQTWTDLCSHTSNNTIYDTDEDAETGFFYFGEETGNVVALSITHGAMAVSAGSKNPERAMMFLNLLNTDPTLMTMLNYGVEGVTYELEDGLVKFTDGRANYQPWTNGVGNVTILTPTVDQGADFWDTFKAYYGNAKEIPVLGFSYNAENCETEMGAVANVVAEYMLPLCTGAVDPDEKLPEFLDKLQAAGIDTVLDDVNAQLDEFMAAKGN